MGTENTSETTEKVQEYRKKVRKKVEERPRKVADDARFELKSTSINLIKRTDKGWLNQLLIYITNWIKAEGLLFPFFQNSTVWI